MKKWILSHGAYLELQRRNDAFHPRNLRYDTLDRTFLGTQIETSDRFPQRLDCDQCAGTGNGGAASTYCQKCAGAGASMIDGVQIDQVNFGMELLTRPLPKAFAVAFPTDIPVPAAPMRGRIMEVRLS